MLVFPLTYLNDSVKPIEFNFTYSSLDIRKSMSLVNIFTPLKDKSFIFSTVERQNNGIMFYSNSATPIENTSALMSLSSASPNIISFFAGDQMLPWAEDYGLDDIDDDERSCRKNLNIIKKALDRYALDHKGKYPRKNGIMGLRQLINKKYLTDLNALKCPARDEYSTPILFPLEESMCDYIYFGGFSDKSGVGIPLLFDKPGKNGHIRILFNDGKVLKLKKNINQCSELIPFLQRKFQYPDRIYKYLIKTAKRYDKL